LNGITRQDHNDHKDKEQRCKKRGKQPGQHGGDVFNDTLLVLNEPGSDDDRPHRPAGQHPFYDGLLHIKTDGLEDEERQTHQNSSPEGDKGIVDKPLA